MKRIIITFFLSLSTFFSLIPPNIKTNAQAEKPAFLVSKSAKWIDFSEKTAEVTLNITAQNNPTTKADIVFVVDNSSIMKISDINNVKTAITEFSDKMLSDPLYKDRINIGIVSYSKHAKAVQHLTNLSTVIKSKLSEESSLFPDTTTATNIQDGIKCAHEMLDLSNSSQKYIFVISGNMPTNSFKITDGNFNGATASVVCRSNGNVHAIKLSYESFTPTECDYNTLAGNSGAFVMVTRQTVQKDIYLSCPDHPDKQVKGTYSYEVKNNLDATVFEAQKAKSDGISVFTIGYGLDSLKNNDNATTTLTEIAQKDCFINAMKSKESVLGAFNALFERIKSLLIQENNITVLDNITDIKIGGINAECSIIDGSIINVNNIGTVVENDGKITWNLKCYAPFTATIKYTVKVNTPLPLNNNAVVFPRASLTYTPDGSDSAINAQSDISIINYYVVRFLSYSEDSDGKLFEIATLEETVLNGDIVSAPPISDTKGYELYWPQSSYNIVNDNLTITAIAKKKIFPVCFYDYDGKPIGDVQMVPYLESAKEPQIPLSADKEFTSWDTESWQKVTEKLEVMPVFEQYYFVTFKDYYGNIIKTEPVKYGQSATSPKSEEITGYEYIGWDNDFTYVSSDITVTALYREIIIDDDIPTAGENPKTGTDFVGVIFALIATASVSTAFVIKKRNTQV